MYNTKITSRIHLIAPRHAFRFDPSVTRKYNVHVSLHFTVEREVNLPSLPREKKQM